MFYEPVILLIIISLVLSLNNKRQTRGQERDCRSRGEGGWFVIGELSFVRFQARPSTASKIDGIFTVFPVRCADGPGGAVRYLRYFSSHNSCFPPVGAPVTKVTNKLKVD